MQSESLDFTVRMDASHLQNGVHAGLAMLQKTPNGLQIVEEAGKRKLQFFADNESSSGPELKANAIELRVHVNGDRAVYSYSLDEGRSFHQLGGEVSLTFSFWKGARPALFAYQQLATDKPGSEKPVESSHQSWVELDWAHYRNLHPSE
jgi:beta-xylosidase-like protein